MQIGRIVGPDGSAGVQSHGWIGVAAAIAVDDLLSRTAGRGRRVGVGVRDGEVVVGGEERVASEELLERRHRSLPSKSAGADS
jgi:hypothetical protein